MSGYKEIREIGKVIPEILPDEIGPNSSPVLQYKFGAKSSKSYLR